MRKTIVLIAAILAFAVPASGALVDVNGNAATNQTLLGDVDMGVGTLGDLKTFVSTDAVEEAKNFTRTNAVLWHNIADKNIAIGQTASIGKKSIVFGGPFPENDEIDGPNYAGYYSLLFGYNNVVSNNSFASGFNGRGGLYSFLMGHSIEAGNHSFIKGSYSTAGNWSFALGYGSYIGDDSFSLGSDNTLGDSSYALGYENIVDDSSNEGHNVFIGYVNRATVGGTFSIGMGHEAGGQASFLLGTSAASLPQHYGSFVWNFVPTNYFAMPIEEILEMDKYTSHGPGSFNINPIGGLSGFWVGETNMEDYIRQRMGNSVLWYDNVASNITVGPVNAIGFSSLSFSDEYGNGTIGHNSISFGRYNDAGNYSSVFGDWNIVRDYSFAVGDSNTLLDNSAAVGTRNEVGNYGYAFGYDNYARIDDGEEGWNYKTLAFLMGVGNLTEADGSFIMGVGHHVGQYAQASFSFGTATEAQHPGAFVWNFYPTNYFEMSAQDILYMPKYSSHGIGSFNINPVGGLSNFWVGETNMENHIVNILGSAASGKQDKLPYPTNAIPYSVIDGLPGADSSEARIVRAGTTNKYDKLQSAISDAAAGDTVEVLKDVHLVGEGLKISESITLTGAVDFYGNPLFTIYGDQYKTSADYCDIFCSDDDHAVSIVFSNLNFKGFGSNAAQIDYSGVFYVEFYDSSDIVFDNIRVRSYNKYAINADSGKIEIRNSEIDGLSSDGRLSGIRVFERLTCTETVIKNVETGILMDDDSTEAYITNCTIYASSDVIASEANRSMLYLHGGEYSGTIRNGFISIPISYGGITKGLFNGYVDETSLPNGIVSILSKERDGWYTVTNGALIASVVEDGGAVLPPFYTTFAEAASAVTKTNQYVRLFDNAANTDFYMVRAGETLRVQTNISCTSLPVVLPPPSGFELRLSAPDQNNIRTYSAFPDSSQAISLSNRIAALEAQLSGLESLLHLVNTGTNLASNANGGN